MECLQQPGNRTGEEVIQYPGKPQLFRHKSGFQLPASSLNSFLFGIRLESEKLVARSLLNQMPRARATQPS